MRSGAPSTRAMRLTVEHADLEAQIRGDARRHGVEHPSRVHASIALRLEYRAKRWAPFSRNPLLFFSWCANAIVDSPDQSRHCEERDKRDEGNPPNPTAGQASLPALDWLRLARNDRARPFQFQRLSLSPRLGLRAP